MATGRNHNYVGDYLRGREEVLGTTMSTAKAVADLQLAVGALISQSQQIEFVLIPLVERLDAIVQRLEMLVSGSTDRQGVPRELPAGRPRRDGRP